MEACLKGDVKGAEILLKRKVNLHLRCNRGRSIEDYLKMVHPDKTRESREKISQLIYRYTMISNVRIAT